MRSVLSEFNERLAAKAETWRAGDGLEAAVRMGPIVDETQLRKVRAKIDEGKRSGARVVRDGGAPSRADLRAGYFVEPTIFSEVDPWMPLAQEEIFGPVVSVIPAEGPGVGHGGRERGGLRGGEAQVPFGGVKDSGLGDRESGTAAFDFFSERRVVYVGY